MRGRRGERVRGRRGERMRDRRRGEERVRGRRGEKEGWTDLVRKNFTLFF